MKRLWWSVIRVCPNASRHVLLFTRRLGQDAPLHGDVAGTDPGDVDVAIEGILDRDVVDDDVVGSVRDPDAVLRCVREFAARK